MGRLSWSSSHLEELPPPLESVTTETSSSDLVNPSPLRQIPESNAEAPFAWDHSLWLLTGAMVMALAAYFPPLSHLVSFGRPLQAAIPVLHWMASWWLVPPGWEPDFVSLAPLSYKIYTGLFWLSCPLLQWPWTRHPWRWWPLPPLTDMGISPIDDEGEGRRVLAVMALGASACGQGGRGCFQSSAWHTGVPLLQWGEVSL
ncbi:hypothetical protein DSO57_1030764 [Entomophthora muscae]|uniref:Uncharacterized protein n=1 Tax=Entomophthora muscae TaxID=34485 RepID=A0ACC2SQ11_9FUNG|nr:hypothetical protein DSO57_1030764 [Entomophthora muscae]